MSFINFKWWLKEMVHTSGKPHFRIFCEKIISNIPKHFPSTFARSSELTAPMLLSWRLIVTYSELVNTGNILPLTLSVFFLLDYLSHALSLGAVVRCFSYQECDSWTFCLTLIYSTLYLCAVEEIAVTEDSPRWRSS